MTSGIMKTKEGQRLEFKADKFHYRAYNSKGEQVGQAWIKLSDLLTELKAEIVGEQNNPGGSDKDKKDQDKKDKK